MTRAQILALSAVCCVFGGLSLWASGDVRFVSRILNIALGIGLIFLAGRDLKQRGWQYGYLIALTYLLPLVGLVTYFALSDRPKREVVPAV
jgi:hypothetical protein